MNNPNPPYQYRLEDSINGLTVHLQRRKQWWLVVLYVAVFCFVGY